MSNSEQRGFVGPRRRYVCRVCHKSFIRRMKYGYRLADPKCPECEQTYGESKEVRTWQDPYG